MDSRTKTSETIVALNRPLNSLALFKSVQVEKGGYAVIWTDSIDIFIKVSISIDINPCSVESLFLPSGFN